MLLKVYAEMNLSGHQKQMAADLLAGLVFCIRKMDRFFQFSSMAPHVSVSRISILVILGNFFIRNIKPHTQIFACG